MRESVRISTRNMCVVIAVCAFLVAVGLGRPFLAMLTIPVCLSVFFTVVAMVSGVRKSILFFTIGSLVSLITFTAFQAGFLLLPGSDEPSYLTAVEYEQLYSDTWLLLPLAGIGGGLAAVLTHHMLAKYAPVD